MATLTRSVTITAPVEEVFDYALDVRNLWSMPDIALAEVDLAPEGTGTSCRLWSHVLGFHIEGRLEYTEVTRPERIVAQVSFFMESPTWTFTFEPVAGGTTVTGTGEWHMKAPVVGGTMERMAVKEHEPFLETMLNNIKTALEARAA